MWKIDFCGQTQKTNWFYKLYYIIGVIEKINKQNVHRSVLYSIIATFPFLVAKFLTGFYTLE